MKRAGGWILGVIVVLAMGGAGWFLSRRLLHRENTEIVVLDSDREPTTKAMRRGAEAALKAFGGRSGRYDVRLYEDQLGFGLTRIWLGTSESILRNGDVQPPPFAISVVDTHPAEPVGCLRITPGSVQQGSAAARWVKSKSISRVFLLRDPLSIRSKTIAESFQSTARTLGLSIEGPADPIEERNGLVERIIGSRVEAVFYSGEEAPYLTAFTTFTALREKGFTGPLAQAEADPEVSLLATRPNLAEGTFLISPFAPGPPELEKAIGMPAGPHVTAGYYAMKATLEAIDHANSIEPEDLRRAAAKLPYFDAQGRAALRKCALYVAKNGRFEFAGLLD